MCGITGYISPNKYNNDAMLKSLHHRGPDNSGRYETVIGSKQVFLGHTRLSIIDLSAQGHQPMFTADKQVAIIYNGEVYNFQELKSEYLNEYKFHSTTDTEVILYLYDKLGINFIEKLNGDFAFCILDQRINKVYLVRDRFGIKPLYYFSNHDIFIFGSEIKSIQQSGIKLKIRQEMIQPFFAFKYVPGNETLFDDVFRLPPASFMEFDIQSQKYSIHKYWKIEKQNEYQNIKYIDAQSRLHELLADAVNIRLIADVPVGTFMSGGIDSSIIASFLKNNKNIQHYCASKTEADLRKESTTSDYYYASKFANDFNIKLQQIPISSEETKIELIRKTIYYSDDLIADGSQIPSYLITQEAGKTSRVILSGQGADELFLGYANHSLILLALYANKFPKLLSKPFMTILANLNQGKGSFKPIKRFLYKLGKYYSTSNTYAKMSLVGDYENSCSIINTSTEFLENYFAQYFDNNNEVYENLFRFETENFLVKNLHYGDKTSMANAVEMRVPYLDHRLVEFAYSLPRDYKLSNTFVSKQILKDTFRDKLPPYILNRRKAGFGMPLRSIFSNQNNVDKLLNLDFFQSFKIFNIDKIKSVIKNHISGIEDNSQLIYALISLQEFISMNEFLLH